MTDMLSAHNAALSFVQTATGNAHSWNASVSKDRLAPLFALIEKDDPDRAADLRREQEEAKQVIRQLRAAQKDVNERRKEAAREKVRQLKAQIQALLLMAGNDPEAIARHAARLARELSAAVKAYASAGGAAGSDVMRAASAVNTSATEATQSVGAEEGSPTAGDDKTSSQVQGAVSGASDAAATGDEKTARLEMSDEQQAQTGQRDNDRDKDNAFARDVRDLMNKLKMIVKNAKRKMQREDIPYSAHTVQQAQEALRDTAQAVNDIKAQAFSIAPLLNITI